MSNQGKLSTPKKSASKSTNKMSNSAHKLKGSPVQISPATSESQSMKTQQAKKPQSIFKYQNQKPAIPSYQISNKSKHYSNSKCKLPPQLSSKQQENSSEMESLDLFKQYEARSRQAMSNCLNQSQSENNTSLSKQEQKNLQQMASFPNFLLTERKPLDQQQAWAETSTYVIQNQSSQILNIADIKNLNKSTDHSHKLSQISNQEQLLNLERKASEVMSSGSYSKTRRNRTTRKEQRSSEGKFSTHNQDLKQGVLSQIQSQVFNISRIHDQSIQQELDEKEEDMIKPSRAMYETAQFEYTSKFGEDLTTADEQTVKCKKDASDEEKQEQSLQETNDFASTLLQQYTLKIEDNKDCKVESKEQSAKRLKEEGDKKDEEGGQAGNKTNVQGNTTEQKELGGLKSTSESSTCPKAECKEDSKDQERNNDDGASSKNGGGLSGGQNLNEDINMEVAYLNGQISMFDQLTDYNENDNEDNEDWKEDDGEGVDEGEGNESEADDVGEDGDKDELHEYRKRIEVLNEDIQTFMIEQEGDESENMCNDVHYLQLQAKEEELSKGCKEEVKEEEEDCAKQIKQVEDEVAPEVKEEAKEEENQVLHQEEEKWEMMEKIQMVDNQPSQDLQIPFIDVVSQESMFMFPINSHESEIIEQQEILLQKLSEQLQKKLVEIQNLEKELLHKAHIIEQQLSHSQQLKKEKERLQEILEKHAEREKQRDDSETILKMQVSKLQKEVDFYKLQSVQKEEQIEQLKEESQILKSKFTKLYATQEAKLEDKTNRRDLERGQTGQIYTTHSKLLSQSQKKLDQNEYQLDKTPTKRNEIVAAKMSYNGKNYLSVYKSFESGKSLLDKLLQDKLPSEQQSSSKKKINEVEKSPNAFSRSIVKQKNVVAVNSIQYYFCGSGSSRVTTNIGSNSKNRSSGSKKSKKSLKQTQKSFCQS